MQLKTYFEDYRYYLDNIVDWIRYRTTRRNYHIVNTGLAPGYHDCDERMIHAIFNLLVDFVEIEKAWMNTWTDNAAYSKLSWFDRNFRRFRSPEDGIAYLNWEINQCNLKDQSDSAKEILDLYTWWKEVRPNRPDPYIEFDYDFSKSFGLTTLKENRSILTKINEIENYYHQEDEDMLIRLMKIRRCLWT
jgi:hypothetical protein